MVHPPLQCHSYGANTRLIVVVAVVYIHRIPSFYALDSRAESIEIKYVQFSIRLEESRIFVGLFV